MVRKIENLRRNKMKTSEAQKKASEKYRQKLLAEGKKQHLLFADNEHWEVIREFAHYFNEMDITDFSSIEIDGDCIKLIRRNRSETRVDLSNQIDEVGE